MKKLYIVRVKDIQFVFSSVKDQVATLEALDDAIFVGRRSWGNRPSGSLDEATDVIESQVISSDEITLLNRIECKKLDAIGEYRRYVEKGVEADIEEAKKNLVKLGIDPSSVSVEEEE